MKIILAKTAGFCMGVRRAMEIAVDAISDGRDEVRTQGELIHNRQAIELLEARGIRAVTPGETVDSGTVIIRAHGIPPEERRVLEASGVELVDATCPHVILSQKRIARDSAEGFDVVLVGDPEHPEVKCLAGSATGNVWLIRNLEEAGEIKPKGKLIVIAQTTFDKVCYDRICNCLQERFPECKIYDSICSATEERQEEARAIVSRADALVVVGGLHSANTRRLAEIGREAGKPTFHIETADELNPDDFNGISTVGVTAGASTPGWMTQQVLDRLQTFGGSSIIAVAGRLLGAAVKARLTVAFGAACLTFASFGLAGMSSPNPEIFVMVALYVFAALTINRREIPRYGKMDLPVDDPWFSRWRKHLFIFAFAGLLVGFVIAWRDGYKMLCMVGLATAAALIYRVPIRPWSKRHKRIINFPVSKDLCVAGAWSFVIAGAVWIESGLQLDEILVGGLASLIFVICFSRRVMLDLRDMAGDRLIGIETLPITVGRKNATRMLYALHAVEVGMLAGFAASGVFTGLAYLMLIPSAYGFATLLLLVKGKFKNENDCRLAMDGKFILSGVAALVWGCQ